MEMTEKTDYIDVIDTTTSADEGHRRKVSLGFNSYHPMTLHLLGGLSHNTEITFDEANAKRLISWLQQLIA